MHEQFNRIPRSPTGRTPQWALDEVMGRPSQPVPFRQHPPLHTGARPAGRGRQLGTMVLVTALVSAGLVLGDRLVPPSLAPVVPQAAAGWPPPGLEESPREALPAASGLVEGQGFRFLGHQDAGGPVTWSPCRPIHYVVRPDGAPPGATEMLTRAIRAVSDASGLTFMDDGPTDEGPVEDRRSYQPDRYGDRWAPVLIAWATPQEVPDFGVDIAGEAYAARLTTPSGDDTYVSGVVLLDGPGLSALAARSGAGAVTHVIAHELGHLVGLAHVDDPAQVMQPRGSVLPHFGAGDLAGLRELGRGACQDDV